MSALGLITLGYQCADKPLGITTLGYFCRGDIPPIPQELPEPGGGSSKPKHRAPTDYHDDKLIRQRKLAMQEDEDFIAILELILRNRP